MTNYEKIKNMSVKEMAEVIPVCLCCCYHKKHEMCFVIKCRKGIKKWLESEADENEN